MSGAAIAVEPARPAARWTKYKNLGWIDARAVCLVGDHLIADGKTVLIEAGGYSCLYCVLTKKLKSAQLL